MDIYIYIYSVIRLSTSVLFSITFFPPSPPFRLEIFVESEESSVKMIEARHVQLQKNNRSGHPFTCGETNHRRLLTNCFAHNCATFPLFSFFAPTNRAQQSWPTPRKDKSLFFLVPLMTVFLFFDDRKNRSVGLLVIVSLLYIYDALSVSDQLFAIQRWRAEMPKILSSGRNHRGGKLFSRYSVDSGRVDRYNRRGWVLSILY